MKLRLQLRLLPDANQATLLLATMKQCNAAATFAAAAGFAAGVHSRPAIHKRCYYDLREKFGVSSQMAILAIGKAAECLALRKRQCPKFRPTGGIAYDQRILIFKGLDRVSLLTVGGRILVPFVMGQYQRGRFGQLKGQCDLVYRNGKFFLFCTIDLPEITPAEVGKFIGVDLGVTNLATTDDGTMFSGREVESVRKRLHGTRASIQKKMSARSARRTRKNARRALRRISNKESRFRRHTNHVISKQIVNLAEGTKRGIGLEDLKHIRARTRFQKSQRAKMGGWSFAQLRNFIEYKAKLRGVPVVTVNPRNTSRTCNACGHCEKANRKKQAEFKCQQCGHEAHADLNAASNIAAAATVVWLEVSQQHRESLVA